MQLRLLDQRDSTAKVTHTSTPCCQSLGQNNGAFRCVFFFSVADLCCCSPTWDLRREHSESVMLPSLITRCCLSFLKNLSFHAARLTVLHVSPSVSVFCVGGLRPRLQQQHYSDWSSTVQHSTGPVQPPSHGSSSLHLCCASNRSVLLYSAAAAASTALWIFHSNCLVDTPGSQFPFCVFFVPFCIR